MIVKQLQITDYKNISCVDVELDEHMNFVAGNNGDGKTSFVTSILHAIGGKTTIGKHPQRVIKNGKDKAIIEVKLEDGKDSLTIKRTITEKGVYLKAERDDGEQVSQTDLDNLFDNSTINITKLLNLDTKGQVEYVKEVAGIDTSVVEEEYREMYAERTILNRIKKEKSAALSDYGERESVPSVSIENLRMELASAVAENAEKKAEMNQSVLLLDEAERQKEYNNGVVRRIEQIELSLKEARSSLKKGEEVEKQILAKHKKASAKTFEITNTDIIEKNINKAVSQNKLADEYLIYNNLKSSVQKSTADVDAIGLKMSSKLKERENIIKNSTLPFSNIEFDKDLGLMIGEIPFTEMSTAQQIRIMSRIYIQANPLLKVVYIKDGSLLDKDTLSQITEMSDMKDFQFLVEVVGNKENAIVMHEGGIVGDESNVAIPSTGEEL